MASAATATRLHGRELSNTPTTDFDPVDSHAGLRIIVASRTRFPCIAGMRTNCRTRVVFRNGNRLFPSCGLPRPAHRKALSRSSFIGTRWLQALGPQQPLVIARFATKPKVVPNGASAKA